MMYKLFSAIRAKLLVYLTHHLALPVLKKMRKPSVFPFTAAQLREFSPGSLGNDLVLFLDKKQLQLLPYYAKHDIKHVLLQYDTTGEGEVCLQSFMLGNGHFSFPVAATVVYGFITMPEYWNQFKRAYRRGKSSLAISDWEWFNILDQPTGILINRINHLK